MVYLDFDKRMSQHVSLLLLASWTFSLRTRCDTNVKLDTSMLPRNLILLTILEMQEGLYHSPKIHFLFHEKDSKT